MTALRVLFLVRRAGPYHLARFEAASRQVALTVVETRPGSNEYPWEQQRGGRSFVLDAFAAASVREEGLRGQILRDEITRVFAQHQPQVVATSGWADPEYHHALLEARRRKVPAVVMSDSTEDDEPRSFPKEALKSALLKNYAAAMVAGERSRAYIQKLGFAGDRVFAPWDVVDNDYFSRATNAARLAEPCLENDLQWLCVARFIPKKNLQRLLSAFSSYVRESGDRRPLALLGSGPLEAELRRECARLQIETLVRFSGFVQYGDLPREYARSLALLLPSLSDQWGLVVNEAMASGLPVLVSQACGCAPDLVEDGVNGFTFSPENERELVSAFRKVGSLDRDQRLKFGDASANRIRRFSTSAFAKALSAASTKALAVPRAGSAVSSVLLHLLANRGA